MSAIQELKELDLNKKWINYIYNSDKKKINYERVTCLKSLNNKYVYNYVLKTLEILEEEKENYNEKTIFLVEETLKWSEVAKCYNKNKRKEWKNKKINLLVHNIGSSEIYKIENKKSNKIVKVLIKTHGLIGQYIRGEINLNKNKELYELILNKDIEKTELHDVLSLLNRCVIKAVSPKLYQKIENKIEETINKIINGEFEEEIDLNNRLNLLNNKLNDKDQKELNILLKNEHIKNKLEQLFKQLEFWYYEVALNDFTIEEQIKILLIISNYLNSNNEHLSFEKIMISIYLDYENKKQINIYKKRIIEDYIDSLAIEDILNNKIKQNPHIKIKITKKDKNIIPEFKFSIQASKLIAFCEVAYTSDSLYNQAVFMLYDLFGFRRDKYDRFYNEINYLNTMNKSINHKSIILDYIVGKNILDVGPGGGALMDLILDNNPNLKVSGIDISENVINTLNEKKKNENKSWTVIKGDALNLDKYLENNSMDTIIYSSIIHELYSYIDYNGKKFNHDTIIKTLKTAYNVLKKKGRIIIRDGIMTEPKDIYRIIEFNNIEDLKILDAYCHDFKGRKVTYEKIDHNKVKMLVNDAMEFLYTYTWGPNSYALEVHEQFGYYTPSEYIDMIKENLPNCKIIECNSFLQPGYEENLLNKISIYDDNMNIVKLPNSTCIIVIEKE
ncbi:MAG: class I SAM-dependent methyltransferase [Firmicutes bacterium]|nr:class I SAM-dependent methyltransferase [Bacillota bacterium]